MNTVVDIIIILYLIAAGITGYKRGFFKEIVMFLGTLLVFFIAYKLKDPVGDFLLLRLPIFDFPNLFKGVAVLNVLVYQLVSFVVILAILLIVYNIVIGITGLFEKLLKITVILAIPSKILGFIAGVFEGYIIAFVILFFLSQPAFSFEPFINSKVSNTILSSSPVLTNFTKDTVDLVDEIYKLKDEKDSDVLNTKILDMMLDKDIVKYDTIEELHDKKKLDFQGIDTVLDKYKDKNK